MVNIIMKELYKVLFNRAGLIVIVIFCIIKLTVCELLSPAKAVNQYVEKYKNEYMTILSKIEGKQTERNSEYIDNIVNNYTIASDKVNNAGTDYISEKITEEDYTKLCKKYEAELEQRNIVNIIKSQQEYVNGDEERRYYIYQNGWAELFSKLGQDYLLLVILLIFSTPMLCRDFEENMHVINMTSEKGRGKLYLSKIVVLSLTAILITILSFLCEYFMAYKRYGISNFSYPVQSIPLLSESIWKCSLYKAIGILLLISIVSGLYIIAINIFLSAVIRKSMYVIVSELFVLLIPKFIMPESFLYKTGSPCALFMLSGYIMGVKGTGINGVKYFTIRQVIAYLEFSLIAIVLLLTAGRYFYCKMDISFNKLKKRFHFFILIIMLFVTGCNKEQKRDDNITVNYSVINDFFENNQIVLNTGSIPFTCFDKRTNENTLLFHDTLMQNTDYNDIHVQYMTDSYVYYSQTINTSDYKIMRLNLQTYEIECIYSKISNGLKGYSIFGLGKEEALSSYEIENNVEQEVKIFWVLQNDLYIVNGDCLYQINLNSKKKKVLIKDVKDGRIAYYQDNIYYINFDSKLVCYSIDTNVSNIIVQTLVSFFKVTDKKLYLQLMNGNIGYYNFNNQKLNELNDKSRRFLDNNGTLLYFTTDNHKIYSINEDGTNEQMVYSTDLTIQQLKCFGKEKKGYISLIGDDLSGDSITKIISLY